MASQQHLREAHGIGEPMVENWEVQLSERAHDLNNLLQIIGSSLHFMSRELEQPDRVRARLVTAIDGLSRCAALTRQMYPAAPALNEELVVVQAVIQGMAPLFASTAGPKVALQLDMCAMPLSAFVDRSGLERALVNLVVNARQAIGGRGRIRLRCRDELDRIVVTVDDNGPGFTKEAAAHAFERRFTTKTAGSGLGLASVKAFAASAGGHVKLSRADLGGARIILTLPRSAVGLFVPAQPVEA